MNLTMIGHSTVLIEANASASSPTLTSACMAIPPTPAFIRRHTRAKN